MYFMINAPCIANILKRRCPNRQGKLVHKHITLEGSRTRPAQMYPAGLCRATCRGLGLIWIQRENPVKRLKVGQKRYFVDVATLPDEVREASGKRARGSCICIVVHCIHIPYDMHVFCEAAIRNTASLRAAMRWSGDSKPRFNCCF